MIAANRNRRPHTEVLRHGVRLQSEGVELVGVDSELLLDRGQGLVVDEEEDLRRLALAVNEKRLTWGSYGSVGSTEALNLRLGRALKRLPGDSAGGNESLQSG